MNLLEKKLKPHFRFIEASQMKVLMIDEVKRYFQHFIENCLVEFHRNIREISQQINNITRFFYFHCNF